MNLLKSKKSYKSRLKQLSAISLVALMVTTGCGNEVISKNPATGSGNTSTESGTTNGGNNQGSSGANSSGQGASAEIEEINISKYDDGSAFADMELQEIILLGDTMNTSVITIDKEGVYRLKGDFSGQIIVDAGEKAHVNLILEGVTLDNANGAPIYIKSAKKTLISLVKGTENIINDKTPAQSKNDEDPRSAGIYSCEDLTISGEGSLKITGNNNGISCKDKLKLLTGNYTIEVGNNAIKGNDLVAVLDGNYEISAPNKKGFKSDTLVAIAGGTYNIKECKEGIEALTISISGGEGSITSSDDGLNANGAEQGMMGGFGGGRFDRASSEASDKNSDSSTENQTALISISGGKLYINAQGDGIDSNGSIEMTGGEVYVDGPTGSGNGALDYGLNFRMTGGTLIAAGSSGMAQSVTPDGCYAVMINFTSSQKAGTKITLTDKGNKEAVSYTPSKTFSNIVICTPMLSAGEYKLLANDNALCSLTIENASSSFSSDGSAYGGGMGGMGGHGNKPGRGDFNPGDMPNGDFNPGDMPNGERPNKGQRPNDKGLNF